MSTFRDYVVEYQFQGARWGTTIKAESFDDAKRRIEAMGAWGHISGELVMTIPVGGGWFVKAVVWLRNFWRRTNSGARYARQSESES